MTPMNEETMSTVRTEPFGDVLLIKINNPPINAGSLTVRQGLSGIVCVAKSLGVLPFGDSL